MRGNNHIWVTIGGILLLSACLVSCSSNASQPRSESNRSLPPTAPHQPTVPNTEPIDLVLPASEEPSSSPSEQPTPTTELPTPPEASSPDVEATTSTITPDPTIEATPTNSTKSPTIPAHTFVKDSPSLHGLALGASENTAMTKFGKPLEIYVLPDGIQSVEIWQYDGYSFGLNQEAKVVYIEVTSPEVTTGIQGLAIGTDGTTAAQILGLDTDNLTQVITIEVTDGWLKLDLDPESQTVISLKLISNDL